MQFKFPLISLFLILFISACGVPGPGGGASSQNEQNLFETVESIKIRVEPLVGSTVTNLSVTTLDEEFEEDIQTNPPQFRVDKTGNNEFTIRFSSLFEERINIFARATVGNGEVYFAPLFSVASANDFIEINIMSHYVVKKFFDAIDTRDQLDAMLPCVGDGECANQPEVKSQMLVNLYKLVLDYETDLPTGLSVAQSLDTLDTYLDLRNQVELGVDEIVKSTSPIAQGTKRAFSITDGTLLTEGTKAKRYHNTLFALSMNQLDPDDAADTVQLSTHTSEIIGAGDLGAGLPINPIYPQLLQTTTRFDLRRDILVSDIPFEKRSLRITAADEYALAPSVPTNTLSSPIFDGFLSTQGNLLHGRKVEQTIPGGSSDPQNIGWQFNPIFSRLYRVNDVEIAIDPANPPVVDPEEKIDPHWLVTSNVSSGSSFLLDGSNNRLNREEAMRLFSWEVYSRETETDFTLDDLNGITYGVVDFSVRLFEDAQAIEVFADIMQWQKSGSLIQETQPNDSLAHFRSYVLRRDQLGINDDVVASQNIFPNRPISQKLTIRTSDDDPSTIESSQRGLLVLDGGVNPSGGTSTDDGRHLTFALNSDDRGKGLLLASELRTTSPIFDEDVYQIQGNSITLDADGNNIRNYNFSSLTLNDLIGDITSDCTAAFTFRATELNHELDTNDLNDLVDVSETDVFNSDLCRLDGGKIEITFNDIQSKPLTLRGFVSREGFVDTADLEPGKLINFIMIHGTDTLGLLFATLEQELAPDFSDE